MRSLLYFLPLFKKLTGPLLLSLGLSLVTLAAGIGLLGVAGWFLTAAALTTAGAAFNLFAPSAGVRGLSFVRILSRYGERLTGHNATLKLLSELRRWLFARLFGLVPIGGRFGRADLVSRLVADIDALDTMFLLALGPITTAAVVGIVMSTLLAIILPGAAVAYAVGFGFAVLLVPAVLITLSLAPSAEANAAASELRRVVLDGIDGHQDLVLFGAVAATEASASAVALRLAGAKRRVALFGGLATAAVQLLAGAILIATLLAGLGALAAGRIEGPVLAGLLLAVVASFEASAVLVRSATRLAGSAAAAERLVAVAESQPTIADPALPREMPPGGDVEFAGVTFGYEPSRPVLSNLGFAVATGECVAIRGPSGAGKSTIAQLLVRLVDPQAGVVRVNGADVRMVPASELRRRVALMTQDAPVFCDSVRANLRIGRPTATDAELWGALEAVRLADAIRQLPRGLDAMVGEAGRSLSAGQARRLCLARTLLTEAPIVVLDEPTSGLDAEAEAAFLADLPTIADGRTMIVVTHAEAPATFSRTLSLRAGQLSEPG